MLNIYQENGYTDRIEYLKFLADEYDVPEEVVFAMADTLTESEDFDGLVTMLQDAETMEW